MKEPSKHMLNGIIIILIAIIIAFTFTINYVSPYKDFADCYKKVYTGRLIFYKQLYKTKERIEGSAAEDAAESCFIK